MFDLLYKEWRLAVHPVVYIFVLIGALVLVPAYPYGMIFFFGCLALYFTSLYARESCDIFYTTSLPISKRHVVKGKCLLFVSIQLLQLVICLPFALLRPLLLPQGNPVGIEANAAFFGFGLIAYALFNFTFLTPLFKSVYQVGKAFLIAILPAGAVIFTMECLVHLPSFAWLDGIQPGDLVRQLPLLAAGILVYIAGNLLAYRTASRAFAHADL